MHQTAARAALKDRPKTGGAAAFAVRNFTIQQVLKTLFDACDQPD